MRAKWWIGFRFAVGCGLRPSSSSLISFEAASPNRGALLVHCFWSVCVQSNLIQHNGELILIDSVPTQTDKGQHPWTLLSIRTAAAARSRRHHTSSLTLALRDTSSTMPRRPLSSLLPPLLPLLLVLLAPTATAASTATTDDGSDSPPPPPPLLPPSVPPLNTLDLGPLKALVQANGSPREKEDFAMFEKNVRGLMEGAIHVYILRIHMHVYPSARPIDPPCPTPPPTLQPNRSPSSRPTQRG